MIPTQDEEENKEIDDEDDEDVDDDTTCLIKFNPKSVYQRRKKRKQKAKLNKKSMFLPDCGLESVYVVML